MSDAKEVEGKQTQAVAIEGVQYYSNKASVNDLKEKYNLLLSGIPERKNIRMYRKYSTKSI